MKCRHDGSEIPIVHDFGLQPIANGFLNESNPQNEYFFSMQVAVNPSNGLFQLVEQPDPKQMFHENYAFFTRTSNFMMNHFKDVSNEIMSFLNPEEPNQDNFVVEIGSNDGAMLEHLVKNDIPCLGVEPSKNVALESEKYGVKTINEFYGSNLSKQLLSSHGAADIIYAANVFCHIPDINDLAQACSILLKDGGTLMFEDPYLLDVLTKTSYDQIYDEHVYLFSCSSVQRIFKEFDLHLYDCKTLPTHGGSMRYYLSKTKCFESTSNLINQIDKENSTQLLNLKTYDQFSKKCEFAKNAFKDYLFNFKKDNKRIVGYGATSKSTTILNYCDIGNDLIDFFTDTTPTKINKFSPGKHIPVLSYDNFEPNPDLAVLFAWNHKQEIMEKEKDYKGLWITHLYEEFI